MRLPKEFQRRTDTPVKLTARQLEARKVKRGFRITVPGMAWPVYITESYGGKLYVGDAVTPEAISLRYLRDVNPENYELIVKPYLKRNGYRVW